MPSLPELQAGFVAAVLRRGPEEGLPIAAAGIAPAARLSIYRTNARENFATALEAAYPALRRLMGREEFRRLAWSFQRRHPSRAGNLYHAGEGLPAFLAEHLSGTPDSHLAELARLEWAVQEVIVAEDATGAFDFEALAAVPAERHGALRFRFDPGTRFVASTFPLFSLWQALRAGNPPAGEEPVDPGIPLDQGGECLLVRRLGGGAELHRHSAAAHAFAAALAAGADLDGAVTAGRAVDPHFDPGAGLAHLARLGALTGFGF